MKELREKVKAIIFNNGGLPGLNQGEYLDEMRKILVKELTAEDKALLNKSNTRIELLIIEISREIAEEIL